MQDPMTKFSRFPNFWEAWLTISIERTDPSMRSKYVGVITRFFYGLKEIRA